MRNINSFHLRFLTYAAIFIVALLSASAFQGTRGLYDRDETRYAECAREMLVTGSWLVPLRDFTPHLTKPPLTYWAIAGGFKLFGVNEWGARMPNALAFSITTLLVGLIAARLFGPSYGQSASFIYLTSLIPFAASNIVTTDTILVMWEVAAIWAFLNGEMVRTYWSSVAWFSIMGLFWGLGFLTKGPAVLPVAVSLGLYWFIRRKAFKALPFGPLPILSFLITGLWWYFVICQRYPRAWGLILQEQVAGRLFSDVFHRNSAWYAPFYVYLPVLTLGAMPWLWNVIKTIGPVPKTKKALSQAVLFLHSKMRERPSLLFLALWWLCPLIVFSIARSRLPLYILPLFVPMAIFFAWSLIEKDIKHQNLKKEAVFTLIFLVLLKAAFAFLPLPQDARAMYVAFRDHTRPVREIDTIEGQFLDGLSFYSKKPVEYLPEKAQGTMGAHIDSSWDEEVMEIKGGTSELYVLDLKKGQVDLLRSMGLEARPLAKFHRYGLFMVTSKPLSKKDRIKKGISPK